MKINVTNVMDIAWPRKRANEVNADNVSEIVVGCLNDGIRKVNMVQNT